MRLSATARLLRISNLPSPVADVVAGTAIATGGEAALEPALFLGIASACLYHGGMALNDYADRGVDAVERPERPIPSGEVPAGFALALGLSLLLAGVAMGSVASPSSGAVAAALALAVLLYDFLGKRSRVIGSLGLGLCRALNLLLAPAAWAAGVHGSGGFAGLAPETERAAVALAALYGTWIVVLSSLARSEVRGMDRTGFLVRLAALAALPFAALFWLARPIAAAAVLAFLAVGLLVRARGGASPEIAPAAVRAAVGFGVRGTILIAAAIAAGSGASIAALVLVVAFFAAGLLARRVPVT